MRFSFRAVAVVAAAAPFVAVLPAHAAVTTAAQPAHWTNHADTLAGAPTTPDPTNPAGCDPIGGWTLTDGRDNCMLPFPNDYFTTFDASSHSENHRRVDFNALQTPVNREGKPIDPTAWNDADGFSIGSQILVDIPGMTKNSDVAASAMPTADNIGQYADPNAGVVVIEADNGKRWPVWAEVDQYTSYAGPGPQTGSIQQDLLIHPAVNFAEGKQYIVALRHPVLDDGTTAQPNAAFVAYRDGTAPTTDTRTQHFNDLFADLSEAGIDRSSLYLAWDFTTATAQNTTGRLQAIRDDAFHQLGDDNLADGKVEGTSPAFSVSSVTDDGRDREIKGSFTVPCYIAPTCAPTGQFYYGDQATNPDAVPQQVPGQTYSASFDCELPDAVYTDATQSVRPSLYGHGLFGSPSEVEAGNVKDMAAAHDMLECGTEWFGMAETDIPNAVADIEDLSLFSTLTDRVQQGELDFMYLARTMIHAQGFCSNADFQRADGSCVINRTTAYYDGNSQGGIFGGTVCALIPDATRCVLGVPGLNYALLLPRSSDYVATEPLDATSIQNDITTQSLPEYSAVVDEAYPDQSQRMLVLDLIQMLWDRSDPDGYALHMTTDPLPNTPVHHVLMQMAWGDHQVANVMAITEARTIGADLVTPALVAQRYGPWKDPFWGLTAVPAYPYDGSALTVFDTGPTRQSGGNTVGTDPPPIADVPNFSGDDPHEAPRATVCGQQQKSDFLSPGGEVTHPCGSGPFFAGGWNGVDGLSPAADLPEAPLPAALAVVGLLVGGVIVLRRRRRN